VFEYCYGFPTDGDGAAFADFAIKGQIETTMPFNDYWTIPNPPIPDMPTSQVVVPLVGAALAAAVLAIGSGISIAVQQHWGWFAGLELTVVLLIVLGVAFIALALFYDYGLINRLGAKPFPTAPHSTLRDVLKALYLQQAFTRFAAAQQGASPAQLRAAFAAFVAATRPDDLSGPTQPPGVVRSQFAPEAVDA
jgi:hypothetical protein